MNLKKIMDNENNMYYGHGVGGASLQDIDSIMNNGLRCSNGALYYTSIALCQGNNVTNEAIDYLKKWPHKSSDKIIIISLPFKYNIIESPSLGTYNCANSAFYYVPTLEEQKEYSLTNTNYVMPEFVKGYYDAINDEFIQNSKYYELLPIEEQEKVFKKVKCNYLTIINDACGIAKYREILEDLPGFKFPLSDEEVEIDKTR